MDRTCRITVLLLLVAAVASRVVSAAPAEPSPQERYIAKYAVTAVREMYRTGVPASITLAQGLLESSAGSSGITVAGNNHFGIKCHRDWTGRTVYWDDDEKGECFRAYDDPIESFRDHSDFLRYRDRYKSLFDLKTTDYKGWAYGLKKAGYATDPQYAPKLIKIVEDYGLDKFDKMTVAQAVSRYAQEEAAPPAVQEEQEADGPGATFGGKDEIQLPDSDRKENVRKLRRQRRTVKTAVQKSPQKPALKPSEHKTAEVPVPEEEEVIPESPLQLEEPVKISEGAKEEFRFSLSRETYTENGVPFVYASEGETYASIASAFHLFQREILSFNDLSASKELLPGEMVYLQAKKNQARKGLDKFIVDEDGMSLRDICQRFGVKMKSVVKMNNLPEGYVPLSGDTILLRGR